MNFTVISCLLFLFCSFSNAGVVYNFKQYGFSDSLAKLGGRLEVSEEAFLRGSIKNFAYLGSDCSFDDNTGYTHCDVSKSPIISFEFGGQAKSPYRDIEIDFYENWYPLEKVGYLAYGVDLLVDLDLGYTASGRIYNAWINMSSTENSRGHLWSLEHYGLDDFSKCGYYGALDNFCTGTTGVWELDTSTAPIPAPSSGSEFILLGFSALFTLRRYRKYRQGRLHA